MYLDTAHLIDIKRYATLGILKGITTNPTLLKQVNVERHEHITAILETRPALLFVQVLGNNATALVNDFQDLLTRYPDAPLGIKVPINLAGLEAIAAMRRLRLDILLLGTAIYSAEQAILAGIAGCDFVAPYVNRMTNNAIDPYAIIATVRRYYDNHAIPCQIMGASFKNTQQIIQALDAGAHTCTIPPELLQQMLEKDLANQAIHVFNTDGGVV
ncbi:MAG: transaldolase family protein [Cardiobacteriaceae bacterium]|nr:transaldolase family protein [Cardiobacteriaceae bacterium]